MSTILTVDDELMMLTLCNNMLKRCGYRILQAASGEEALRILEKQPVDLALLDVMMPKMNGIELAQRIQAAHPKTKILLMSGYSRNDIVQVAGQENPYRIIWKPFKADSLCNMIANVLSESAGACA